VNGGAGMRAQEAPEQHAGKRFMRRFLLYKLSQPDVIQ